VSEMSADDFRKNFLKIILATAIVGGFFYILMPFCISILFGGILAMAFSPIFHSLTRHGSRRKLSLFLITLVLFLICLTPISIVLVRGSRFVTNALAEPSFFVSTKNVEQKIYTFLDHFSEKSNIDPKIARDKFDAFVSSTLQYSLNLFKSFLSQIPDIIMLSIITILSFYFFLLDEDKIRIWFNHYFYFSKENSNRFITIIKASCKEVFISNVITSIVQASMIAIGAFFCNIGDFFIIFIITFFLSFIPIGASPVGFILAAVAFNDNRIGAGITMSSLSALSVIIDNIIRPYLNSRGTVEVPLFVNFIAIVGGVITMGLVGLFVGPLLASLTYGVLPVILDEWYPKKEELNND
jgi:predicted PurR-regulated permease PerM